MKNLPCLVALSALASLLVLSVAATLGASLPFMQVASYIIGFSCAAGVLALGATDCAPRSYRSDAAGLRTTEMKRADLPRAKAVRSRHRVPRRNERLFAGSVTGSAMATLGVRNDPATLSLV